MANYTGGCWLHYVYFKDKYYMIENDLSKEQVLDADPKAIQKINFVLVWYSINVKFLNTKV